MKFCIHKWYIHKFGNKSERWKFLSSGGFIIIMLFSSVGLFWTVGYTTESLGSQYGIFWGLAAATLSGFLSIYSFGKWLPLGDPWSKHDKTCIKCEKIILNATKEEEKLHHIRRDVAKKKREINYKYIKYLEMYKKATS